MIKSQKGEGKKRLRGKRVVLTRSKGQSEGLRSRLEALGAEVLELPLIKVSAYCDPAALDEVFSEMGTYEWIIFTSRNGVQHFFNFFFSRFKDIRCIGGIKIACVGPSTAAEVEKYHLEVDFMPEEALAENLGDGLMEFQDLDNTKVLVITGNLNGDGLVKRLATRGKAIVDSLQVYETELVDLSDSEDAKKFREQGADVVVFASSSAVDSFAQQAKNLQLAEGSKQPRSCSIGPQTSKTMQKVGMPVDLEAREHSVDGIVAVILEGLGGK